MLSEWDWAWTCNVGVLIVKTARSWRTLENLASKVCFGGWGTLEKKIESRLGFASPTFNFFFQSTPTSEAYFEPNFPKYVSCEPSLHYNTPLRSQSRQLPDVISIQISQPDLLSIQITFQIPNYFQITFKLLGSKNTAACSPSVSICNRAVGSWTKSSDLVQKIPLSPFYSLSLSSRPMVNMRTLAEYDNFHDDLMTIKTLWRWKDFDDDVVEMMMIFFFLSDPLINAKKNINFPKYDLCTLKLTKI